jgi:predicted phosphoribosyltransferase
VIFQNRSEAGFLLGREIVAAANPVRPITIGILRGGVAVGVPIARQLKSLLRVIPVSKLSPPDNPEFAIGAIAPYSGYYDNHSIHSLNLQKTYLKDEFSRKKEILKSRIRRYKPYLLTGKDKFQTVVLVDDGVATGATIIASVRSIRNLITRWKKSPVNILLAIPVIARDAYDQLQSQVDKIIALEISGSFSSVGKFYTDFLPVGDREILSILKTMRGGSYEADYRSRQSR